MSDNNELHAKEQKNAPSENLKIFVKSLLDKDEKKQTDLIKLSGFDANEKFAGLTPLAIATLSGASSEIAKLLVNKGANIKDTYINGMTILHLAAGSGNNEIANFAIAHQVEPKAVDEDGNTFLHVSGLFSTLSQLLLKFNPSKDVSELGKMGHLRATTINSFSNLIKENDFSEILKIKNNAGITPFLSAAQIGNKEILQTFLEKGANLTDTDLLGNNILLTSAGNRNLDGIEFALEHGIDPNSKNSDGHNALVKSIWSDGIVLDPKEQVITNMMTQIQQYIAKDNTTSISEISKYCYDTSLIALNLKPKYGMEKIAKIFDVLLSAGANPDVTAFQFSMLEKVVAIGQSELVDLMLSHNASIDALSHCDTRPLGSAITFHHLDSVKKLLQKGADYKFVIDGKPGDTPLHKIAAHDDDRELLSAFIESKVDLDIKNKDGLTPLTKAVISQRMTNIDMLLAANSSISVQDKIGNYPIHYAAAVDFSQGIERLANEASIRNITNYIDVRNNFDQTPLALSAFANKVNATSTLLNLGCDLTIKNFEGDNPLHTASGLGYEEIVKLLLEHNANPNDANNGGSTPLMFAATGANLPVMKLLIDKGARIEAKDLDGDSVLAVAITDGMTILKSINKQNLPQEKLDEIHFAAVSYLVDKGADLKFVRKNGQNLLHIAAEKDSLPVFELLHKKGVNCKAETYSGLSPFSYANNLHKFEIMEYITKECFLLGQNSLEEF